MAQDRSAAASVRHLVLALAPLLASACGAEPVRAVPLDADTHLAATCVVPIDDSTGNPLVSVLLDGNQARLMLDTGSEGSVVEPRFARQAGLELLPYRGTLTSSSAGTARRLEHVARVRLLELGEAQAFDLLMLVVDLEHLGRPIDGVLGMDVLGDWPIVIDAEAGALHLVAGELEEHFATFLAPGTELVRMELRSEERRPFLGTVVEGLDTFPTLLDTGATLSAIPRRMADALGLEVVGSGTQHSAIGSEERERRRVAGLPLGPWRVSATATVVERDMLLLGYDLLAPFVVGIDTPGRRLVLAHQASRRGATGDEEREARVK